MESLDLFERKLHNYHTKRHSKMMQKAGSMGSAQYDQNVMQINFGVYREFEIDMDLLNVFPNYNVSLCEANKQVVLENANDKMSVKQVEILQKLKE